MIARRPTTPTRRMSPILAMPTATVAKMIGGTTARISVMKASLSGFISVARLGQTPPSNMPAAIAISTCTHVSLSAAASHELLQRRPPGGRAPQKRLYLRHRGSPYRSVLADLHDHFDRIFDALAGVADCGRHLGEREGV